MNALANGKDLMSKSEYFCELFCGGWIKKIADTVKKGCPGAECPVKDS